MKKVYLRDVIACYTIPLYAMPIQYIIDTKFQTAAVAQWVRAFSLQAEGWLFEFQPR